MKRLTRLPIPSKIVGPTWSGDEKPADQADPKLIETRAKLRAYFQQHGAIPTDSEGVAPTCPTCGRVLPRDLADTHPTAGPDNSAGNGAPAAGDRANGRADSSPASGAQHSHGLGKEPTEPSGLP